MRLQKTFALALILGTLSSPMGDALAESPIQCKITNNDPLTRGAEIPILFAFDPTFEPRAAIPLASTSYDCYRGETAQFPGVLLYVCGSEETPYLAGAIRADRTLTQSQLNSPFLYTQIYPVLLTKAPGSDFAITTDAMQRDGKEMMYALSCDLR